MDNQLIIKIILIVLFVVFGIALILPAVGARSAASSCCSRRSPRWWRSRSPSS